MHAPAAYLERDPTELAERVERAYAMMEPGCRLCPRRCGARRLRGEAGACGAAAVLRVASATLHFGEEPPISGRRGSGTVFVSRCNLRCLYCQNYPISQLGHGNDVSPAELAERMLELQGAGAHNINWVTPSHEVAHLLDALARAAERGLRIPVVYNSSGYDAVETLRLLEGIVDIYMPDMRYADPDAARECSGVADYPEVNRAAVAEMHRQVGELRMDGRGVARRGLLVRHLVLPGGRSGTAEVMRFLAEEISPRTYVSLMRQYFPAYRAPTVPGLDRRITEAEYAEACGWMERYGLRRGWRQDAAGF